MTADAARTLAVVQQEIRHAETEHRRETGLEAYHVRACARPDLHDRLAGLYAEAQRLARPRERRAHEDHEGVRNTRPAGRAGS